MKVDIEEIARLQKKSTGGLEKIGNFSKDFIDYINHPKHYNSHPSGVECIQITEHMNYNLGTAIAYIWRHEYKNGLEDLKKAQWHLNREIERLENLERD